VDDPFFLRCTSRVRRHPHEMNVLDPRSRSRVVSDTPKLHFECRVAGKWLHEGYLLGLAEVVPSRAIGFQQPPAVVYRRQCIHGALSQLGRAEVDSILDRGRGIDKVAEPIVQLAREMYLQYDIRPRRGARLATLRGRIPRRVNPNNIFSQTSGGNRAQSGVEDAGMVVDS